jgi:hypothetical protein
MWRHAIWGRGRGRRGRSAAEALRRSANRGCPFGSQEWQAETVKELGLESTMRPRGRPRMEVMDA